MKREEVMKRLGNLGDEVVEELETGNSPSIEVPVRTLSNIKFNEEKEQLELGSSKSKRNFMHVNQSRKFMQTLLVAA